MDAATERLTALLAPLTNYERHRPDRPRWSLDNMRALLCQPGLERSATHVVQIGGSKGKGTTALYLESLALAAGLRTGTYMSPHLQSLLERVRLLGRDVAEAELHGALVSVLDHARALELEPSFFEVMTAAALKCFGQNDLHLGILEVGLGGRLDATTAVPVDASVVTSIELEHTLLLGDTVEEIAGEKAFVIREGRPAFTATSGAALAVLEQRAKAVGASLSVLDRDFALLDVAPRDGGFAGRLRDPGGEVRSFWLPEASAFELPALALAVACLSTLRPDLALCLDPVPRPRLPGRCEVRICGDGEPLVLDVAHTERSMQALAGELARRFPGRRSAVLVGFTLGKRWRESLSCLLPGAEAFAVTGLPDTAMESPAEIAGWLRQQGAEAEVVDGPEAGLRRLAEHAGLRVVTGSFYVVGRASEQLGVLGISTPSTPPPS